ncbi:MAG: penicillin-binding protein activator [Alphaproteobacteria bacterium]|nr:penicillin-binding protein activator [Alphaproteobacteria bacterium]
MIRSIVVSVLTLVLLSACQPADQMTHQAVPAGTINTANLRPPVAQTIGARPSAAPVQQTLSGASVKVALLLPITGRHADLGRAMQDAAVLSQFDKYATLSPEANKRRVELVTYDTGDTPEQARDAANEAVDDGVVLIIGPVFADATQAVAPVAEAAGLSVISFSNNLTVARPNIYLFGFSPEQQTKRVVDFATTQGRNQLAALVPNSAYGQAVLATARSTITKNGGGVVAEALYSPQGVGVEASLASILPQGKPAAFDSMLLPEGGTPLATILRGLRNRGVQGESVKLLGTGLWDDPTLLSRVNLEGAWFATSPPQFTHAFETRFQSTYKYQAPRVASLSYDAVALAITIVTSGRSFTPPVLTGRSGFHGPANGIFRFRKDGTSERGLAVLQVRGGSFEVISPSPASFR